MADAAPKRVRPDGSAQEDPNRTRRSASWPNAGQKVLTPRMLLIGTGAALLGTAISLFLCAFLAVAMSRLRDGLDQPCTVMNTSVPLADDPFTTVGTEVPEMYGKVREKTIWAFWHHPVDCPSSMRCVLPDIVQLCTETVEKNRGSFDYKIIRRDEVTKYITRMELPLHYETSRAAQQKDAIMNAVLARYGGVALDITSILLRPLDDYWDEMIAQGASFRGYMYRVSGNPWGNSEVTAVWFLMSRREGIFNTAVRSGIIGMGDYHKPPGVQRGGYHNPYFAFGDQTLTPILTMFNYSLPKCVADETVAPPNGWRDMCPEHEFVHPTFQMPGPPRNDAKILLREPRDGPQLPFAFIDDFSMGTWHVASHKKVNSFIPPTCDTMTECWHKVFLPRYLNRAGPGETRLLNFLKLFNTGGRLKKLNRQQLLADKGTYFYHWLMLAGLRF